jgi:hypothetical protein
MIGDFYVYVISLTWPSCGSTWFLSLIIDNRVTIGRPFLLRDGKSVYQANTNIDVIIVCNSRIKIKRTSLRDERREISDFEWSSLNRFGIV